MSLFWPASTRLVLLKMKCFKKFLIKKGEIWINPEERIISVDYFSLSPALTVTDSTESQTQHQIRKEKYKVSDVVPTHPPLLLARGDLLLRGGRLSVLGGPRG